MGTFFFCYFCCQTISGGHFNPAISLATGVSAHTDNKEGSQMFIYMFAQFVGCFVGVVMFYLCRPAEEALPGFLPEGGEWPEEEVENPVDIRQYAWEASEILCDDEDRVKQFACEAVEVPAEPKLFS